MTRKKHKQKGISRREFLSNMRWAPLAFLPAPLHAVGSLACPGFHPFVLADYRLRPHYPARSPLDDVLGLLAPGTDAFITENYAAEIGSILNTWSAALTAGKAGQQELIRFVDDKIEGAGLGADDVENTPVRSVYGLDVTRRRFSDKRRSGREQFVQEIEKYFAGWQRIEVAEFQIVGIEQISESPRTVRAQVRYDIVGARAGQEREERVGKWTTEWRQDASSAWRAVRWDADDEVVSRARWPFFADVTEETLGGISSYKGQLLHGSDYWRTVLDGACGIDVYGNNGIAAGDFDGDGFDDLYICQGAGLPNRLYRNRGDGTFEDVTERAGVGVLDDTACALFADFENRGRQDLLVVCGGGPLLFENDGGGKFALKKDAFRFAQPPAGTFTHAAAADYDRDGRLDVYFCLYSYYLGLDQYHYPAPYFDARNGPPNFLMRNMGDGVFEDRTAATGLNAENDRYSFACAWGAMSDDGGPDLYVANDFGRSNLYRNNGDGTFKAVSAAANVEDPGAGMSACWADFDGDGLQDIYVSNMWSAAGLRVSGQKEFHPGDSEEIRGFYRQHAQGNSLYRNGRNGKFQNVAVQKGANVGGWAWSSDSWDFDHDGWPDLYVANGYISSPETDTSARTDAGSFFWRQVVGKSPSDASVSSGYERGWNAINELIRSDTTWNGYERNVLLANNGDGTFSPVAGVAGMDFLEDSRSFALADLDHDGRLEVVLKNRSAPQVRVLRNVMEEIGGSVAFRLRGTKSNRDAVGAAVTVEADGRRQTKYLQAGTGFLSQHSKDLFFGVGKAKGTVLATVRWPGGSTQSFSGLPLGNRIEIEEGSDRFIAMPFSEARFLDAGSKNAGMRRGEVLPTSVETWLVEPLRAPDFSLMDSTGTTWEPKAFTGTNLLLNFWSKESPESLDQLRSLQKKEPVLRSNGVKVAAICLDSSQDSSTLHGVAGKEKIVFPMLRATPEMAGVYNIVYRYLFDRRRDIGFPTSFLIDGNGQIVKVYQGAVSPERIVEDAKTIARTAAERIRKALPFEGSQHLGSFQRNEFTYGVAFFQRGYLDQAAASFRQVIETKPDEPEAYYNLGTLFLRRNSLTEARRYLEQAVKLRENYPEAWNNLGMIAGQEGKAGEAIESFRRSIALKPDYVIALVNLGNFYRRQEAYGEAETLLGRALELEPDNAEVNYSVGMLYARENQMPKAIERIERAIDLRPDYADALNNLGVLLVRQQKLGEAKAKFESCIAVAPDFDQAYLNLARLYVLQNDKAKAREVLQALLEKQPQHAMARQALEMLN
jgi:Flp pilus assembly protein TadD/peroxiredoxin